MNGITLLMRNHVSEFVPGCDYTAVKIDHRLVDTVARRAARCRAMLDDDGSLADISYWDSSPMCMQPTGGDAGEEIERALDEGDGWAILDDAALHDWEVTPCECTLMTISLCGIAVLWEYRVGSEPVQTVNVGLKELAGRLGHPLGDPLAGIP